MLNCKSQLIFFKWVFFFNLHVPILNFQVTFAKIKLLVLTWEEGDKLIQELHAFMATLSLRAATLLQEP